MASFKMTAQAKQNRPALAAGRVGGVIAIPFTYILTAALVVNDVVAMCKLPRRHLPVDFRALVPDLDTNGSPTILLDWGFHLTDVVVEGASLPTAVDADEMGTIMGQGQAGGFCAPDVGTYMNHAVSDLDQYFTMSIPTGPATGATSGTISGILMVRPVGLNT